MSTGQAPQVTVVNKGCGSGCGGILAALLLIALLAIAVEWIGDLFGTGIDQEPVPNVIGQEYGEARALLERQGFDVHESVILGDPEKDTAIVTDQVPAPGATDEEGDVELFVDIRRPGEL